MRASVLGSPCFDAGRRGEERIITARTAPLIVVTTSELRSGGNAVPTPEADPAQHEMVLGLRYLRAIERAGGMPVVVPPIADRAMLSALLDRASGVCLTGGPDLDPQAYGEAANARLGPTWRDLDECELSLAQLADDRQVPVLGICRGLQTINVSRGGTLHQHLPDVTDQQIRHRQSEPGVEPTHWVSLSRPSRVAEILQRTRLRVNSFHHQGVAELGRELRVTGRARDGTVESIEATDRAFLIGVQWHAETMPGARGQAPLFDALIDAALSYEAGAGVARRAA
ncbi:MAG TPA: gamma-glutamyl-gamma-aminobutyrate hydrolase family protein [Solirubrobacteraceae bacterium]|nr:gamma-glutamyl-gamma-aminobutyrate hydrolase family protein [Solirubrobacteraceae bacterium]